MVFMSKQSHIITHFKTQLVSASALNWSCMIAYSNHLILVYFQTKICPFLS